MSTAFTEVPRPATAAGSTAVRSPALKVVTGGNALPPPPSAPAAATAPLRFSALDWVFAEQQDLSAVERFARKHEEHELPANERFYRDLIPSPAHRPEAHQQYAFEVDLDLCTGCKACVTGCHNLNGLDEGETWRTVGLLHGGTAEAPSQQTITTACHHCSEPACLSGCPVKAYEKDPVTGIVKHLDDQCIGCQYCVLMCPYDAPKYNPARGIVRKCDMCSDRLSHGEAPACVQSCPNEAIRIAVVDRPVAIAAAAPDVATLLPTFVPTFLPGAPSPTATRPTTVYKNGRALAAGNMVPGDLYTPPRQAAHPPLVVMLALTQLSVGALAINLLLESIFGGPGGRLTSLAQVVFAFAFAALAMAVMPLHLGRPQYAFRALLGLRTSWLSREILAFSAFMGVLGALAASFFVPPLAGARGALALGAVGAGAAGVACSVMVYAATRRAHWRAAVTGTKFALSAIILGSASVQVVSLVTSAKLAGTSSALRGAFMPAPAFVTTGACAAVTALLVLTVAAKLIWEWSLGRPAARRVAAGVAPAPGAHLETAARARLWFAVLGGLVLPVMGLLVVRIAALTASGFPLPALLVTSTGTFLACLAGELCERYLFFAAAPPSKMPGAPGAFA